MAEVWVDVNWPELAPVVVGVASSEQEVLVTWPLYEVLAEAGVVGIDVKVLMLVSEPVKDGEDGVETTLLVVSELDVRPQEETDETEIEVRFPMLVSEVVRESEIEGVDTTPLVVVDVVMRIEEGVDDVGKEVSVSMIVSVELIGVTVSDMMIVMDVEDDA